MISSKFADIIETLFPTFLKWLNQGNCSRERFRTLITRQIWMEVYVVKDVAFSSSSSREISVWKALLPGRAGSRNKSSSTHVIENSLRSDRNKLFGEPARWSWNQTFISPELLELDQYPAWIFLLRRITVGAQFDSKEKRFWLRGDGLWTLLPTSCEHFRSKILVN